MVSMWSIVAIVICIFLTLVLPVSLAVGLCVMRKLSWKPLLCGLTMFSVSQVLFRMPLISMVQNQPWYVWMTQNPWIIGLFLALTAGLVEEWARYFGSKFFIKGQYELKDAISYGLGHGGIEAIIMLGIGSINNLMVALSINSGSIDELVSSVGAKEIEAVKNTFINTSAMQFLMGGIERIMAMIIQIGLSVLVFTALRSKKSSTVWAAVLLHTIINLPIMALSAMSMWTAEAYILICCLFCVWMIFALKLKSFDTPLKSESRV